MGSEMCIRDRYGAVQACAVCASQRRARGRELSSYRVLHMHRHNARSSYSFKLCVSFLWAIICGALTLTFELHKRTSAFAIVGGLILNKAAFVHYWIRPPLLRCCRIAKSQKASWRLRRRGALP